MTLKLAYLIIACVVVLAASTTIQLIVAHDRLNDVERQVTALTRDNEAAAQSITEMMDKESKRPRQEKPARPQNRAHRGEV